MGLLACWQVPQAVQRRAAAVLVQPGGRRQAAGSDECARARAARCPQSRWYHTGTPPRPHPPPGGRVSVIGRFRLERTYVCSGPSLCVGSPVVSAEAPY